MTPAIFLDRDGTLVEERGYLTDVEQVHLSPHAAEGLHLLAELGWPLVVVSNQGGVAKGALSERTLQAVNLRMMALLAAEGAKVDAIYYCPHHPEGTVALYQVECACRKPKPGLLIQAAKERKLQLQGSFMIGDHERDLKAGRAVGATTILLLTGHGRKTLGDGPSHPEADYIAADLLDAAGWIRERIKERSGGQK